MAIRKRVDLYAKKKMDAAINKIARHTVLDTLSSAIRDQFSEGKLTIRELVGKDTYAFKLSITHSVTGKILYAKHVLDLATNLTPAHRDYAIDNAAKLLGQRLARAMRTHVLTLDSRRDVVQASRVTNIATIHDVSGSFAEKKKKKPTKKRVSDSIYPPWREK